MLWEHAAPLISIPIDHQTSYSHNRSFTKKHMASSKHFTGAGPRDCPVADVNKV